MFEPMKFDCMFGPHRSLPPHRWTAQWNTYNQILCHETKQMKGINVDLKPEYKKPPNRTTNLIRECFFWRQVYPFTRVLECSKDIWGDAKTQRAHNVETTSHKRRGNVTTLHNKDNICTMWLYTMYYGPWLVNKYLILSYLASTVIQRCFNVACPLRNVLKQVFFVFQRTRHKVSAPVTAWNPRREPTLSIFKKSIWRI